MSIDSKETYADCPICSGTIAEWRIKQNAGVAYRIDRCKACGYAFVNPRPSQEFLFDYYEKSGHEPGRQEETSNVLTAEEVLHREREFPNSILDARRILDVVCHHLPDKSSRSFLDVGCGYGLFSREAQSRGFDLALIELAATEGRIAEELTGVTPSRISFEGFECGDAKYSVILMSQILEHAQNVDAWMEKAKGMLVPGGILCVAVPNFDSLFRYLLQQNEPYITPPTHLNFFNSSNLSTLFGKHGFSTMEIHYASRVDLNRRVSGNLKPLAPIINVAGKAGFKLIDLMRLGMIINVFGQKE